MDGLSESSGETIDDDDEFMPLSEIRNKVIQQFSMLKFCLDVKLLDAISFLI